MPGVMSGVPFTPAEPITEVLHGVPITDPYRWLEDQDSPGTREWLREQAQFARSYLDGVPGRDRIRTRIQQLLAVETYDSLQKSGDRYFFRKRLPSQEQPCVYMRNAIEGEDELLIDPSQRGTGGHIAVRPIRVSYDGRLLLYEVKEGGERTGTFELLEIATRRRLDELLPRGYLRGFAFAPDSKSFYYAHEVDGSREPFHRAVRHHILGTPMTDDDVIFPGGEDRLTRVGLIASKTHLAIPVHHFGEKTFTDVYLKPLASEGPAVPMLRGVTYLLGLVLLDNRILAITDRKTPNRRIVELRLQQDGEPRWIDLVPESDMLIKHWVVAGDTMFVSYVKDMNHRILLFDLCGNKISELTARDSETVRVVGSSPDCNQVFLETESFTEPIRVFCYSAKSNTRSLWAQRTIPFNPSNYDHVQVSFTSTDGTRIPMFLVGRRDVLESGSSPTIMTSYGGHGVSITPQFSIFAAFLMENGCLFALPNIRGGSEFGVQWHNAAKRHNRQNAYDDFLSAAEWLITSGRTHPQRLAIFGGSNSGLLVGVAMTQKPELFRAVVCMVPILDMVRYHLFDNAHAWKEEFGTSDDSADFAVLLRYSPYHNVRDGAPYPATMIVSGDADRTCNPLHARKMTARLQSANRASTPIFLDYSKFRGHSAVLPLADRIDALTDRMAFLCDQLQLTC